MIPFSKSLYKDLLKGVESREVSLKEIERMTSDFRLEAEFYTVSKNAFDSVTGEQAIVFSQYGTSAELNEEGKGYPVLRLNEFDSAFIGTPAKYCELDSSDYDKLMLKKGDVLICRTNGNPRLVGKSALVPADYKYAFASYLFRIRPNDAIINSETLVAYLNSRYGRDEIERFAMRGNQANFSPAKFRQIQIPLMGECINTEVRRLTRLAFETNEKSKRLYRETEQLLLTELDFVDWSPTAESINIKYYSDCIAVGRIDAEYFQPKYDEIEKRIKSYKGGTITARSVLVSGLVKESDNTQEHYVELADIGANGQIEGCTTAPYGNLPSRARQRMQTGQVIASSIEGSLDRCALVPDEYDYALCSTGFHRFQSKLINPETLLLLFKSWPIQQLMKRGCSGTILSAILPDELTHVVLPLVDPQLQKDLAAMVQKSFALRRESKHLLELAKRTVERAIEQGEETALKLLNQKGMYAD